MTYQVVLKSAVIECTARYVSPFMALRLIRLAERFRLDVVCVGFSGESPEEVQNVLVTGSRPFVTVEVNASPDMGDMSNDHIALRWAASPEEGEALLEVMVRERLALPPADESEGEDK